MTNQTPSTFHKTFGYIASRPGIDGTSFMTASKQGYTDTKVRHGMLE